MTRWQQRTDALVGRPDERRIRLVGAGAGLAACSMLAGRARGAMSRPDSMAPARRELERAVRTGFAAGSIGWIGGFGTLWRSDPARDLTAILLTQREFESPTPAPLYNAFERAAGLRQMHGLPNNQIGV